MEDSRDAIGISLQVVATFMAALAYVLQKQAHVEISATPKGKKSVYRNRKWVTGFALMTAVAIIDVYSFSLLDQTKQAAFGAVTLAWNTMLASIILHESFTVLDCISVIVIMAGTIIGLSNASPESSDFTFREIVGLLHDELVYIYTSVVLVGILFIVVFVERTSQKKRSVWTKLETKLLAFLSPWVGGMFMGFTGYGAKAIATVIFNAEWEEFKNPELYGYVAMAGFAVAMQVRYLNKGLEFFDALAVVPIFQSAIIFSNALAGIVYYHDMRTAPAWKLLLFAFGGSLCIGGISLLLLKTRKPKGGGYDIPGSGITRKRTLSSSTLSISVRNISPHNNNDSSSSSIQKKTSLSGFESSSSTSSSNGSNTNNSIGSNNGGGNPSGSSTMVNPGTPLLQAAKKPGGSRKSSGTNSFGTNGSENTISSSSSSAVDSNNPLSNLGVLTVNSPSSDSPKSGFLNSGDDIKQSSSQSNKHSQKTNDNTTLLDHTDHSDDENNNNGGGGSSQQPTTLYGRARASTKKLKDLVISIEKPIVEAVIDWPEPPLGVASSISRSMRKLDTVDESNYETSSSGSPTIGRSNSNNNNGTIIITNEPQVEHWWDMEVATATRLVWIRLTGRRYSHLEV